MVGHRRTASNPIWDGRLATSAPVGDDGGVPPFPKRLFHHRDFDLEQLVGLKAGRAISVCLPARNEEHTVGAIVSSLHRHLVVDVPLIDDLVVIDDQSTDETATVAAEVGARVVSTSDLLPQLAKGPGKGQAMWKSLYATEGDLVAWCDADIRQFDCRFVTGVLGPLLVDDTIGFVKGYYDRPIGDDKTGGGRVTELVARPLISTLFPHLSSVIQPLAGEYGGRRDLLEQLPFVAGYGVELGLLVDLSARFGVEVMAQVDLGERHHRNRQLDELGAQAASILHTALRRMAPELLESAGPLIRPGHEPLEVDGDELPPMREVPEYLLRGL